MKDYKEFLLKDCGKRFNKSELLTFDSWRGLLAMIVVIAHANQIFILPLIGDNTFEAWFFGVLAHFSVLSFFVLSGIFISMSLTNNVLKNSYLRFNDYIVSRISRIYPPFIFSILLCIVIFLIIHKGDLLGAKKSFRLANDLYVARNFFTFSSVDVFNNFLFFHDSLCNVNGPLWSLIIEWRLYFIALFCFGIFFSKKTFLKLISGVLFLYLTLKVVKNGYLIYSLIWIIGGFYYFFKPIKKIVFLIGILGFSIFLFEFYRLNILSNKTDISNLPTIQISFSIIFISLIHLLKPSKILLWFSRFSYTLYIIHLPIFLFVFSLTHQFSYLNLYRVLLIFAIAIFSVVLVANRSAIFFENKSKFYNLISQLIAFRIRS